MVRYEYIAKGLVHATMFNPWPVNKDGEFEGLTAELNKMGAGGWELVAAVSAGNNDREICFFRREVK